VKTSLMMSSTVIEPLLNTNERFQPVPGLAEKWEQVDDLTWRFHLRQGVKFQDGEPFDADAVVFSVKTVRDTPGTLTGYFKVIADVKAVSPEIVEIRTTVPTSIIPALMTFQWILPPHYYESVGKDEFGRKPVGTGPYKFDHWTPGQEVSVVRADSYWGSPAQLGRITWKWAGEPQSRVNLLKTGAADLILDLPPQLVASVDGQKGLRVESVRTTRTAYLEMNMQTPPFSDIRARKAVWMAIDRKPLVDDIWESRASATTSIQPYVFASSALSKTPGLPYDPDKSRQLLSEMGSLGPINLHYPKGRYPLGDEVVQAIAGMLTSVGFTIQLDPMETGAFFNLKLSNKMDGLMWATNAPLYPHEDQLMKAHFRSGLAQFQYCHDAKLDAMIDKALSIGDDAERNKAYSQINDYVVSQLVCWMPLYDQTAFYGVSDHLKGLVFRPDELVGFQSAHLEE
jgi:peptide/nickel transport system substrate-binding protein